MGNQVLEKINHVEVAKKILADNPILYTKINDATAIKNEVAEVLVIEVVRFLHLIALANQRLTPSLLVDKAWHELILCTRYYQQFCETYFGRFIHHHPGGDEKENQNNFKKTIQLYREHFGMPPEAFWGCALMEEDSAAACGLCTND